MERNLGKTSITASRVGLGGIPIQRIDKEEAKNLVSYLLDNGLNFIDTARGYTCSEEFLGYALENKKGFFIATKSMARTYEGMMEDIEKSLKNLKVQAIDLYQVHNLKTFEEYEVVKKGAYKALLEAKEAGIIKHIGVTSHSYEFLDKIMADGLFETIQFPYNIVESKSKDLFKKAKSLGLGTICMKPLGGGAIDDASLAIKFLLNDPNVDIIIPGMATIEEAKVNLNVSSGDYTEEEIKKIDEIKKELDHNFCRRCGYCAPCSVGIDIQACFLFEGYYKRYDLGSWAKERYASLKHKANECIKCGACMKRCPYEIDIISRLKEVSEIFDK